MHQKVTLGNQKKTSHSVKMKSMNIGLVVLEALNRYKLFIKR